MATYFTPTIFAPPPFTDGHVGVTMVLANPRQAMAVPNSLISSAPAAPTTGQIWPRGKE